MRSRTLDIKFLLQFSVNYESFPHETKRESVLLEVVIMSFGEQLKQYYVI